MKNIGSGIIATALGLALAGLWSPAARADVLVDVYIYNGSTYGTLANATTETAAAAHATSHYQFTYNFLNNVQWDNTNPNNGLNTGLNTGGDFLGSHLTNGDITSWIIGSQAAFNLQNLSVAGDSQTAFFKISGVVSGTVASGAIQHDDGASFIIGSDALVYSPFETSAATDTFVSGKTYSNTPFNLYYVEGNGSPAILNVTVRGVDLTTGVPEPSSWAMMVIGFLGVGLIAYRRRTGAFRTI